MREMHLSSLVVGVSAVYVIAGVIQLFCQSLEVDRRTHPAWRKKFLNSFGLKALTTRSILRINPGIGCSAAWRRCAFNLLKACSIELRSREYGRR